MSRRPEVRREDNLQLRPHLQPFFFLLLVLMQRGLRLNSEKEEMWLEYFKLELIFLAQMRKKRSREDDDEEDEDEGEGSSSSGRKGRKLVSVPALSGEKDDEADLRKKSEFEESKSFYEGAIPRLIFQNATKAIGGSVDFRIRFVTIAKSFGQTQQLRDFIYSRYAPLLPLVLLSAYFWPHYLLSCPSITKDLPDNDQSTAALCKRPYDEADLSTRASIEKAVQQVCDAFDEALTQESSADLWGLYVTFLQGCLVTHKTTFEQAKSQFLSERLTELYKKLSNTPHISEAMITEWISEALKNPTNESLATAIEVATLGVLRYPMSQALWLSKINLSLPTLTSNGAPLLHSRFFLAPVTHFPLLPPAEAEKLFRQAIKMLPERNSVEVWHSYLTWLIAHPDLHGREEMVAKFEESFRNTGHGTERLLILYLTWTRSTSGLGKFRDLAARVVTLPQVSEKVITECLAIEEQEPKPSISKRRILLESLVSRFKSDQRECPFFAILVLGFYCSSPFCYLSVPRSPSPSSFFVLHVLFSSLPS